MSRKDWLMLIASLMFIAAAFVFTSSAWAAKTDMLSSTVRIKLNGGTGSGVVISNKGYIVTAAHVARESLEKLEAPDGKGMVTIHKDIEVQFFRYEGGRMKETIVRYARVVAFDELMDIAILKLNARTAPIMDGDMAVAPIGITPELFDEVFSVGAGLSMVPFPTKGIVASLDGISSVPDSGDPVFILHSAHVIWGFSGGGLFRYNPFSDKYELVGINVQVAIRRDMNGLTILTFMSYAVRIQDVLKLAEKKHVKL